MRLRRCCLALLMTLACGDDGSEASTSTLSQGATGVFATTADSGTTQTTTDPAETTTGAGTATQTTADDGSTDLDSADTSDTGISGDGPIVLYEGPIMGGTIPGWDPDDPRPLIMLGQLLDQWIVTLARVDADGSLSDNTAQQLVVWGWQQEPPRLYDGPVVGGSIPGWSSDDPTPVVMMGYDDANGSWVSTLASIAPDGSLGDNLADRIIVWGWFGPRPGAPSMRYSGPIAGGQLPGWDPGAPEPLVMLARFSGEDVWQSTLVSIGPGGELRGNIADELLVWSW